MAIISARGLGYRYPAEGCGEVWALKDVNLSINKGEFVAVLGPNGSGKSTFAKQINALLTPTEGEMLLDGLSTADATNHWRIRQRAGMVFQNPDNQIVATTVEEDVAFGPENLGVPAAEIRRRVAESLALVGMSAYRLHASHLLSGGQKQRVAIAGVIAMRPVCLVLDEPTALLDPRGRREVMDTISRLNREEGITVIHITHFMEEALAASRVLVLGRGRVVLDGKPRQVFQQYDELRALGLDVPAIAELVLELRAAGQELPPDVMTVDELVAKLCS
ncbi:MAG: energy-coupling factor transporter ATPase [Firmicutes bacterium]|nr:energy-coupling factor transporter ATPase [Bacillota bacterium]MCL5993489.1 energy-coupling factor transporter ATPase [Bacillota bacterium]